LRDKRQRLDTLTSQLQISAPGVWVLDQERGHRGDPATGLVGGDLQDLTVFNHC